MTQTAAVPQAQQPAPLVTAHRPVGPGAITVVGLVLAVLVVALGVVGVRDALVAAGAIGGSSWTSAALDAFDGLVPQAWLVPFGVVALLLGLWLLVTAVRPRPRSAIAVTAQTGVFLRPRDVAALAVGAAREVGGVTTARARASRRAVSVTVQATAEDGVREQVSEAVTRRLSALETTPTVRVNVTTEAHR